MNWKDNNFSLFKEETINVNEINKLNSNIININRERVVNLSLQI